MGSYTHATLAGRLGADPENRYTQQGTPVLSFRLATNVRRRNKDGEWEDATLWWRVTHFGDRALKLVEMLGKGQQVLVAGRMDATIYWGRDQQAHLGLELVADDVVLLERAQPVEDGLAEHREASPAGGLRGAPDLVTDVEDLPF